MLRSARGSAIDLLLIFTGSLAAVVAGIVYCAPRPAPSGPPILVVPKALDLGPREFGTTAIGRFVIENPGQTPLQVGPFKTSCSCAGVEVEHDGAFQRVVTHSIPPGQQTAFAIRIAVGARPGSSQRVSVYFPTNDPQSPEGVIEASISRVMGGVYAEPSAAIFGDLKARSTALQSIRLYDNGVKSRTIRDVRSSHPERFEVALVPLINGVHEPREHESAGRLIAVAEVRPRSGWIGRFDGTIEVVVADESRAADRIDVIGEVLSESTIMPSAVMLPRIVGGAAVHWSEVVIASRDGLPVRATVETTPSGFDARMMPGGEETGRVVLRIERRASAEIDSRAGTVRLKLTLNDTTQIVEIPVHTVQGLP